MWTIAKKEWQQYFNGLSGYLSVILFLLINGLVLFLFPNTNLLDAGYASVQKFFNVAPWIFVWLIPTITMRSFSEEFKIGTFELLQTLPFKTYQIIWGKFLGALLVIILCLVPTIIYPIALEYLSTSGGIDWGSTMGSYIGLLLLGASYIAIGICVSCYTANTMVAFLSAAFLCYLFFNGLDALAHVPFFHAGLDYYIDMIGMTNHYKSLSIGLITLQDIAYFLSIIILFLLATQRKMELMKH
ncbi:MAG: ABC transporter permease subunit [Phycisphaerales bacterium]|nr:ABC transporter permease subunit [Phycisphaerales bacterium]